MANFTALKTAIQNAIKQNGNEEITGNLLQDVLLAIVTTLGDGSISDLISALDSEATTRSQADGTLQQNIDAEANTRNNADTALGGRIDGVIESINAINTAIGNGYVYAGIATPSSTPTTGKVFYLALTAGTYTNFDNIAVTQGINILKYNGSTWSLDAFVGIDDTPTPSSNNLVKSGGIFNDIITNGSAFDLSAYNNGTTYADLNAALTALNALPAAYKKGGMSIKFIRTSDNKYVQARCMAQNFTTDVTQWQGVDDKPIAGSRNLVESAGISSFYGENNAIEGGYLYLPMVNKGFDSTTGSISDNPNPKRALTDPIREYKGSVISVSCKTGFTAFLGVWGENMIVDEDYKFMITSFPYTMTLNGFVRVLVLKNNAQDISTDEAKLNTTISIDRKSAVWKLNKEDADERYANKAQTYEKLSYNSGDIKVINKILDIEGFQYGKSDATIVGVLTNSNTVNTSPTYNEFRTSEKISINGLRYLVYEGVFVNSGGWAGLLLLDSEDNVLSNFGTSGTVDLWNYPLAKTFRFCYQNPGSTVKIIESDDSSATSVRENKIKTIEKDVDSLENEVEEINDTLYENNGDGSFGENTSNIPSSNFVDQTLLITIGESYSTIPKGYISKIRLWVVNNCTATFYVGWFDQNHYAMNTRPFTVSLNAGYNEVDVRDKNIIINENEQLFLLMGNGVVPKYYTPSQKVSYEVYAGSPSGVLTPFSESAPNTFPNGLCINMGWDIDGKVLNVVTDDKLSEINDRIDAQAVEIDKMQYIIDPITKIPYKLFVVNGEVVPRAQVFRKVLAIGNSLTDHYETETYLTHGYGMAASSKETSWTYLFERVLKQYNNDAVVTPFCGVGWEANPTGDPSQLVNLDGNVPLSTYLAENPDCIIFRLGENYNHATSVYKEGLETLLDYLIAQCPSATIIICSLFWHNDRDVAFAQVADEYGLKFVNTGTEAGTFREIMGDYNYNPDRTSMFPIVSSGVAAHMTDLGFYLWARILTDALGFTQLPEELHEIHVTSAVTFNLKDRRGGKYMGVYRGLISILTYEATAPTVTVSDENGNNIAVTSHDMSQVTQTWDNKPTYVFTFDMPNSDVNVNITA